MAGVECQKFLCAQFERGGDVENVEAAMTAGNRVLCGEPLGFAPSRGEVAQDDAETGAANPSLGLDLKAFGRGIGAFDDVQSQSGRRGVRAVLRRVYRQHSLRSRSSINFCFGQERPFRQVAWDMEDYVLISKTRRPKAADLSIPKPMVSIVLY